MELFRDYFESFIGTLEVVANGEYLLGIGLSKPQNPNPNIITQNTIAWLESYFKGKPKAMNLPLLEASSPFLQKVRRAVMEIEFGSCRSYKEVAEKIENPKAFRAVAMAMKRNPYMIYVPCHRVIGARGIGGYTPGVEIKKRLLEFEKCESISL